MRFDRLSNDAETVFFSFREDGVLAADLRIGRRVWDLLDRPELLRMTLASVV